MPLNQRNVAPALPVLVSPIRTHLNFGLQLTFLGMIKLGDRKVFKGPFTLLTAFWSVSLTGDQSDNDFRLQRQNIPLVQSWSNIMVETVQDRVTVSLPITSSSSVYWYMAAKGWITIHVHTYSKQSHNHTIKYESMSLVVGEAIAYKRIFKPISPCKNNWEFICRSETISGWRITHIRY